jgi:DNA-binding HxlR family transcriptional regulator
MPRIRSYGQFCPVAMAAEVFAERWTPLVLRELLYGHTKFNALKRGVPLMSPSLLSQRLKQLQFAGIVERVRGADGQPEYLLTEAGEQLRPIVEGLGAWGLRWLQHKMPDRNLDVALLMWDLRRNIPRDVAPPERRTVVEFRFAGIPSAKRLWWLVFDQGDVDLCIKRPGFDIDLRVDTDVRTLTDVWMGQTTLHKALDAGTVQIEGPRHLRSVFRRCFDPHPLARMPSWPWPTLSPSRLGGEDGDAARSESAK